MVSASDDEHLLHNFLKPLELDLDTVCELSRRFLPNFESLSASDLDQFLATPISESILRPVGEYGYGRHLAIDIGGTNFRVGFVELLGREALASQTEEPTSYVASKTFKAPSGLTQRHLEKSWPIDDHLKSDNAESLFRWFGRCIAEVVREGTQTLGVPSDETLPLGVTFSFPMAQNSLSEAMLTSMGKGFAIPPNTNLGTRLEEAYAQEKDTSLPPIKVTAIANDSVSTLISFIFRYSDTAERRPAMGLILGTGCNATIPLKLSQLHRDKRPYNVSVMPGEPMEDVRIAVNTEWSIHKTATPMRELGLVTRWDEVVAAQSEIPGFQPLEYMTAGRYLGELGRITFVDYLTTVLNFSHDTIPEKLLRKQSLTTTFLSNFKPCEPEILLTKLEEEFPHSTTSSAFKWNTHHAVALYRIAKAIELRASGIVAAATVALLRLADELPPENSTSMSQAREVGVGFTGGCIVHFQDYLQDCQELLDQLIQRLYGKDTPLKVVLCPCHDGGITGAGILVAAAIASKKAST